MKSDWLKIIAIYVTALGLLAPAPSRGESPEPPPKTNKLLYMYHFYYLPFSLEFREGRSSNDVLPFLASDGPEGRRLLQAEELQVLDSDWAKLKEGWKGKSLLLSTAVPIGQSVRISQRMASHRIPLTRGAFDTISINDRILLGDALKNKSPEVQAAFKQLRFVKSFLTPQDDDKFNFFIVSASWCESSREYRVLLETYFKQFPDSNLNLHSLMIEDPKEEIFESRLLKELFPNPSRYTHDSVPRFLAIETVNGQTNLYEEGEALEQLYKRFFAAKRGYLDAKTGLFAGKAAKGPRPEGVSPALSAVTK